jgi:mannose-6-phosphate isomerase-like protein (cupin superfamily)
MIHHKNIEELTAFSAGDDTILKEVWHSKNDDIDLPYSLAHAYLDEGHASLSHILHKSEETYIFLSGSGEIIIDDQVLNVKTGSTVIVPKGANQYVKNTGSERLVFLCIVSPPWNEEEEEVLNQE